ncbi:MULTISPECIES: hypothetical protein [unclassified Janthinobacterium]|uniref:hypothetical protein n=1 Tax=unclassified Janthinobacterium TaxID=2610881 RepID=UPI001E38241A|nr:MULTISPECIES: hypothetical protein [unclassified Janthinobacterium]MCC7646266.1 hypothetical protein [Janthinobacterium sp. EB271-G4-3-1]MCC7694739.1 hypothetical protein [Janthinobacterium sp. EB271-G4-3-2]
MPGVVPLGGVVGGVVVPSGLVVPGVAPGVVPGVVVSGVVVPDVPLVPLVPGAVAGFVVFGEVVAPVPVSVSLRLLHPPSSAQTMALPRTSLLVVRSGAVMIVPFQWNAVVEKHALPDGASGTRLASFAKFRVGRWAQVHHNYK